MQPYLEKMEKLILSLWKPTFKPLQS